MSKYGRRLTFGYAPTPVAAEPKRAIQRSLRAETLGLDCIGIRELPGNADYQDAWTLLTAIGMATSCASVFSVTPVRNLHAPLAVAKAAASLDLLTNGRVDIAWSVDTDTDQGILAKLEEAIQVMRMLWEGGQVVYFKGESYHFEGEQPVPTPTRPVGIWLEGHGRKMLDLIGRLADGWIAGTYGAVERNDLVGWSEVVDEAAQAIERHPSQLRRILLIEGSIGGKESEEPFRGSVKQWAETLADLAIEVGIDTFVLVEGENAEVQLELFAHEVVPFVRELAELAPGVSPVSGLSRAYQGAAASGATPVEEATEQVDLVDETSMESFPASDPPASAQYT